MLSFFGRGSAFSDKNNCAFFRSGDKLVLIDCSVTAFNKVKSMPLDGITGIEILVTHTHSDHVNGVAMLIDYMWFVKKIPVTVIAPSEDVRKDLQYLLHRLDGCELEWYTLVIASEYNAPYIKAVIPTTHSQQLTGRCFGYNLDVDGTNVVYTGDSNTIEPFKPYISSGTELYMETSFYKSDVHMHIDDQIAFIKEFVNDGVSVYLMHLDDEARILEKIYGTGAKFAPVTTADGESEVTPDLIYGITDRLYKETCKNDDNDHHLIFGALTELGKNIVGADRASFWKWDKRRHELWTTAATGVDKIIIPDNTGLVG
ncbi:MAG: MBL fold metallo-hydrolase [Clostridiales bacterium]|nr:MBL fold metallo-hydrolase [Clostridiales bacterium]